MKKITVWFSCGIASAVALKKTIELYGDTHEIIAVNNPIINEHEDNRRFLTDIEKWCGIKIHSAINSKYPEHDINSVFRDRKYMSGVAGAPCTLELKKKARQEWEAKNHTDYIVLGFTFDEKTRHERFIKSERNNVLPVLIDLGLTKSDCEKIISDAGIKRPKIYDYGFPNANCIGCVKSTSPYYWSLVRTHFPLIFKERSELSKQIGCKLIRVNGRRVFLDELPEDKFIKRTIKRLKSKAIDCGIFCEEK